MSGHVTLVGAGPGDPELLTRRAVQRLRSADVVLYDALVNENVLSFARRARRICVGKRAGRPAVHQGFINSMLVHHARAGKQVVRLKGGDPFVFGRGGEEALALAAAGIDFEVVPGVSSAIAAPALSGIPVTHRGRASGFVVVSGHAEAAYRPILEGLTAHSATVIVMMGLTEIHRIAALLMSRGWSAGTPAAILLAASTRDAETHVTSLSSLAIAPLETGGKAGTVVIGDVVALRTNQHRGTDDRSADNVDQRPRARVVCHRR
jgi:uroporphyrin-III C-methyltransferase / precorrin-2 dehydrogenase / sirohydrochlorin ferrochelatase